MLCFPLDNIEYEAKALGAWLGTRTRGVFSAEGNLAVAAAPDMTVTVSPGLAWLKHDDFWGTVCLQEDTVSLQLEQANTALPRIDAICLRLDKNAGTALAVVKQGDYATQPSAPRLQRDTALDEICLATVYVGAGATGITPAAVTDTRLDESLCGLMRDGVTAIPTAQLQAQASGLISTVAEELHRVNNGEEAMLKTQYASDAEAEISEGALRVSSVHTHPTASYEVCFTAPAGHDADLPLFIDGVQMEPLTDLCGEAVTGGWAAGAPVTLTRRGSRAFFKQGGAGLNLHVATGATRPAAPRENTVWVNTTLAVSDWVMSMRQPATAPGLLWLRLADADTQLPVLKKHQLIVSPVAAEVYDDTAKRWVEAPLQVYFGGAWVSGITKLFYAGNQYASTTGGWSYSGTGGSGGTALSINGFWTGGTWSTARAIDITAAKTLVFRVGITVGQNINTSTTRITMGSASRSWGIATVNGNTLQTLSLASVTGLHALQFYHWASPIDHVDPMGSVSAALYEAYLTY